MAQYKVPQDVEAEDKLLGPFSFRQFVYLMIVAGSGALMFFLGRSSIVLAVIPAPIFFVFGALALPLRKDQPMETYLAAVIRFWFKPRKRMWEADGSESLIAITNPKVDEGPQLKEFGGQEAANRLSFLSQVVDTQGWSTRGVVNTTNLVDDVASDAITTPDILDDAGTLAQNFGQMINQSNEVNRQRVEGEMEQAVISQITTTPVTLQPVANYTQPPAATPMPPMYNTQPTVDGSLASNVRYSPYPESIRQSVIQPMDNQAPVPSAPVSDATAPPEPIVTPPTPVNTDDTQGSAAVDDDLPTDTSDDQSTNDDIPDIIENNDNEKGGDTEHGGKLSDDDEVVISLH